MKPWNLNDGFYYDVYQWLRYRRRNNNQLISFLSNGTIVFPDETSELIPSKEGYYLTKVNKIYQNYILGYIIRAHRTIKFSQEEAFGATSEGESYFLSFAMKKKHKLPFVCNPGKERLEIFGYDTFKAIYKNGGHEFYAYRHGQWRLLNFYNSTMGEKQFREAESRMRKCWQSKGIPYFGSDASRWGDALAAGVVTEKEYEEARIRSGPLWHYAGD